MGEPKRKLLPDGTVQMRHYYDDGKSRLKSKIVTKQTYHVRFEGDKGMGVSVHRITEGDALPWCLTGRTTKGKIILHRTDEEVDCKKCIKGKTLFLAKERETRP